MVFFAVAEVWAEEGSSGGAGKRAESGSSTFEFFLPPAARDSKPPYSTMETSWRDEHWKLSVFSRGGPSQASRWRIAVSRRVLRRATARNRWKRRIREVLRWHKPVIRPGLKASFQLLWAGDEPDFKELQREILELLSRGGLLVSEKQGNH